MNILRAVGIAIGVSLMAWAFSPIAHSQPFQPTMRQDASNAAGGSLANLLSKAGVANQTEQAAIWQWGSGSGAPSHLASGQTTAPALTTCGTSPSISGTDTAGAVTMGSGSPTGCVITFNVAYKTAPYCIVQWQATPLASQYYSVSTTAITLTQTGTSSNVVNYLCVAPSGG
jgi:hypothetical protein